MSASSVSNNNKNKSISFANNLLINDLQSLIQKEDYHNAVDRLIFFLKRSDSLTGAGNLYFFIQKLLPHHSEKQFQEFCNYLPLLLSVSIDDEGNQYKLALDLGDHFIEQTKTASPDNKLKLLVNAMHYYGQALRIKKVQSDPHLSRECHLYANKIFILLLKDFLVSSYEEQLDEARRKGDSKRLKALIERIENVGRFCTDRKDQKEVLENLQNQAIRIDKKKSDQYDSFFTPIGIINKELPKKLCTERYVEDLQKFRDLFQTLDQISNIQEFQKFSFNEFQSFFKILLDDALAILGQPPCTFDIRAMGSIGKREVCPFSDLEFFILIENSEPETHKYFNHLVKILELLITFLGEYPDALSLQLDLSCIHPPRIKGFYFDQSPSKDDRLINTPSDMAKLQNEKVYLEPGQIEDTVLKSSSLYTNDPELYQNYCEEVEKIVTPKDLLKQKFSQSLSIRKKKCNEIWSVSPDWISLKNYFIEPIIYVLGDLSIYFGKLKRTNPFEIITELIKEGFFLENNKDLLNKAISFLYQFRSKVQLYYQENKEEINLNDQKVQLSRYTATLKEKDELEKIFWLIIYPLHSNDTILGFHGKDLVKEAFAQGLQDPFFKENPKNLIPLVTHIAKHLEEENADLPVHREYYERISTIPKREILRTAYIDALQEGMIRNELAKIPNREGKRQQYRLDYEQLHKSIEAITVESKPQEDAVKVVIPYSNQTRYLHPEVAKQILDKGRIKSSYNDSLHHVAPLKWGDHSLHLKELPSNPLMEFAIHNLFSRIAGEVSAPTELVRFEGDGIKPYPVLISKTIPGKRLSEWIKSEKKPSDLNIKQWTWLVLCTLLVKAGDGRLSNYIVDEKGNIFSIDNDVAFVEPVVRDGFFTTKINFSSVLFLLSKSEDFLDAGVLKEFLTLDHDLILTSWIDDAIKKKQQYKELFTEEEKKDLYIIDKNGKKESFSPETLFAPGTLVTLRLQWQHLKQYIESNISSPWKISNVGLLKQIITFRTGISLEHSVGDKIHRTYLSSFKLPLEKRLDWITSRKDQGSKTLAESQKESLGKIPTEEELKSGEFSIEQAKEELLSVILNATDHFNLDILGAELRANFKYLRRFEQQMVPKTILVPAKEEIDNQDELLYISKFVPKNIFKSEQVEKPDLIRQDFVLRAILQRLGNECHRLSHVSLRYCSVLNEWNILNFLNDHLKILDLRNVSAINAKILARIAAKCPKLEELYLSHLPLNTIGETSLFFPSLKVLSITDCPNLLSVKLISREEKMFKCHTPRGLFFFYESENDFLINTYYKKRIPIRKEFVGIFKRPQLEKIDFSNNPCLVHCDIPFEKFPNFKVLNSPFIDLTKYDHNKICQTKEDFENAKNCFEQLYNSINNFSIFHLGIKNKKEKDFYRRFQNTLTFENARILGIVYKKLAELSDVYKGIEYLEKANKIYLYRFEKKRIDILDELMRKYDEVGDEIMAKKYHNNLLNLANEYKERMGYL